MAEEDAWGNGFSYDGVDELEEVEVVNDPGVERVGSAETWRVCEKHWKELTATEEPSSLVLSDDAHQDRRLYNVFRSQFGLDVRYITWADLHNDFEMGKWRAVLSACEGRVKWHNMMYLLRADATKSYVEQKDDKGPDGHSDGLLLVPRIQWLMIEIARNQEGVNDGLHLHAQTAAIKQLKQEITEALTQEDNAPMLLSLLAALGENPVIPEAVLRKTRIGRVLTQKLHGHASSAVSVAAHRLTTQWKHAVALEKLSATGGGAGEAAAFALTALRSGAGAGAGASSPSRTASGSSHATSDGRSSAIIPCAVPESEVLFTPSPQERRDGRLSESGLAAAHAQFEKHGVIGMFGVVPEAFLRHCVTDVDRCLGALETKLAEHGLALHDKYDFEEVRHRPGGRVDSRYQVLDGPCGDPQMTQSKMLYPLLKKILNTDDPQLLWSGVVHAFGAGTTPDPPHHQVWHRDGPSLFGPWSEANFHPSHCVNVFIPLVDITKENGPTDFFPGTHHDPAFEALLPEVLQAERAKEAHPNCVAPLLTAGSAIVFDIRVLHRGRANFSPTNRPMLYYTFATPWYTDLHMFSEKKSLVMSADLQEIERRQKSISSFASALRATVGGLERSPDGQAHDGYGHPHYTERFDLLIAEALTNSSGSSNSSADAAMQNAAAVISFNTLSVVEKQRWMQQTVDAFSASGSLHDKKRVELQTLQLERRAARAKRGAGKAEEDDDKPFIPASSFRGMRAGYTYKTGEQGLGYYRDSGAESPSSKTDAPASSSGSADFGSVNDDMSVVQCLYRLAVDAVCPVLAPLGFSEDSDGLLAWFALAKAVAASAGSVETKVLQPYRPMLEEALTGWWHAGVSRFELRSLSGRTDDATGGTVIVVCSSLGTGIVRPEWGGTLRQLSLEAAAAASAGRVDVLHVIDPSSTWWSQDPGCRWDGFSYYQQEVAARVAGYDRVLVLGDSMGGGGALMLAPLAHRVLCFTPQLDLASYPAITRTDFDSARRATYKEQIEVILQRAVREKGVQIEVRVT
eukprot:COSAG02_NODE_1342_length_13169_cov_11.075905_5_plen_1026_part_00